MFSRTSKGSLIHFLLEKRKNWSLMFKAKDLVQSIFRSFFMPKISTQNYFSFYWLHFTTHICRQHRTQWVLLCNSLSELVLSLIHSTAQPHPSLRSEEATKFIFERRVIKLSFKRSKKWINVPVFPRYCTAWEVLSSLHHSEHDDAGSVHARLGWLASRLS